MSAEEARVEEQVEAQVQDAAEKGAERGAAKAAKKGETNMALKVAVMSTLAALTGSAIGVGGSVYTANRQLDQQLSFRLEERKREAYLNYLSAAGDLHARLSARRDRITREASQELLAKASEITGGQMKDVVKKRSAADRRDAARADAAELKEVTQSQANLIKPLAEVAIYGSPTTVDRANKLESELRMATMMLAVQADASVDESADDTQSAIDDELTKVDKRYTEYVAAVRDELGVLDKGK